MDHVHTLQTDVVPKRFLLRIGFVSYCSDAIRNTQIRSNSALLKKVEQSDFGIYKPSDALCNLCLRLFNFTIIFHDDKKDENKVIGNGCIHVNSPL